jgi:hypothetical protein
MVVGRPISVLVRRLNSAFSISFHKASCVLRHRGRGADSDYGKEESREAYQVCSESRTSTVSSVAKKVSTMALTSRVNCAGADRDGLQLH